MFLNLSELRYQIICRKMFILVSVFIWIQYHFLMIQYSNVFICELIDSIFFYGRNLIFELFWIFTIVLNWFLLVLEVRQHIRSWFYLEIQIFNSIGSNVISWKTINNPFIVLHLNFHIINYSPKISYHLSQKFSFKTLLTDIIYIFINKTKINEIFPTKKRK